jgi:hypothetical protein
MRGMSLTLKFTMAGLDPATRPSNSVWAARVARRNNSFALADARLLGGWVEPGHGEGGTE